MEVAKEAFGTFKKTFMEQMSLGNEVCKEIDFRAMAIGRLNDKLQKSTDNKKTESMQIPKPKIPDFDGTITTWRGFRELYDDLVHNNESVTKSAKIHILKSRVKGDAAKLIGHIAPTIENYDSCYEILCNRYENKREIIGRLIDTLLAMKHQGTESVNGLKTLHDTVQECIMSIKNYGIDIEQRDPLLSHLMMKKLNSATILDYEKGLKDVKVIQKTGDLMNYIEKRFLALDSAEMGGKNQNVMPYLSLNAKKNGEKNEKANKCGYCDKSHSIYECDNFKKIEPQKRMEWAKTSKACFKCLQMHKFGMCSSKHTCKKCGKGHSTLLHLENQKKPSTQTNSGYTKAAMCATVRNEVDESEETIQISANVATNKSGVLLATALVNVVTGHGEALLMKALIDQGSQGTFI